MGSPVPRDGQTTLLHRSVDATIAARPHHPRRHGRWNPSFCWLAGAIDLRRACVARPRPGSTQGRLPESSRPTCFFTGCMTLW